MVKDGNIQFDFIYDRASIVAIQPNLREAYAKRIKSLMTEQSSMLMIALIREEGRQGPPHTVPDEQVMRLYPNAKMIQTNEDLSSLERLGKIVENVYIVKQ